MKKIFFFLLIYLIGLSCNASTLNDLGYKSVFRAFYPIMFNPLVEINDYEGRNLPQVGIESNGKKYLALMHPVQEYQNAFGEDRYLVFVEKREIDNEEVKFINGKWVDSQGVLYNFSNTCSVCYAQIDFKIFKKISNGQFKLVSSSQDGYESVNGNGIANIDITDLKNKVKKVGETKVGFFYTHSNFSHGTETTVLNMLVLDENQIKDFSITIVGSDDSGKYFEQSPLSHTLKGDFKLKTDYLVHSYYPIEIKFKGDTYDIKSEKIIDYNKTDIYEFSLKENEFLLISSTDN